MSSDALFELIESLSPSEVAYFKKYSRIHSQEKKPNYVRIFEALEKQDEYNEQAILQEFEGEAFTNNFATAKGDLKEKILESLREYHSNKSIDARLKKMLDYLPILFEKKLFSEMQKRLRTARKLAEKHEKHLALLEIINWERRALFVMPNKKAPTKFEASIAEQKALMQAIQSTQYYQNLNDELFFLRQSDYQLRRPENELRHQEIMRQIGQKKTDASLSSILFFHNINAVCHRIDGLSKEAFEHYRQVIDLFESNVSLKTQYPTFYKKSLCGYLSMAYNNRQFDEFPTMLKKIKSLPQEDIYTESEVFKVVALLQMLYYINTARYEAAADMVKYIRKHWATYSPYIRTGRQLAIFYNITVLFLALEQWKKSLVWLDNILHFGATQERKDIQGAARILQLIIFYELKDWDSLENRINSGQRNLRKNDRLFLFEKTALDFFRQLVGVASEKEKQAIFDTFAQSLKEFADNPKERKALGLGEVTLWCMSRLKNISIREVMKQQSSSKSDAKPATR